MPLDGVKNIVLVSSPKKHNAPQSKQSHAQEIAPHANLIDNESAILRELQLLASDSSETILTDHRLRFFPAKEAWANPPSLSN